MRKFLAIGWCALLAALLFCVGCGTLPPMPAGFEEAAVQSACKEVITQINTGDYQGVIDRWRDAEAQGLTAEFLQEAVGPRLAELGAFTQFGQGLTAGDRVEQTGEEFAYCVMIAEYAGGKARFTVSFDRDMQLIGLYMA